MAKHIHAPSLLAAATAICAGLYAVGCYATAYIPSPWGMGQFRPAVVIPAFFAIIFGPLPAATGAAIGTLIADSVKHGQLYIGSLIAAVPGNFIGFYVFGYILKKKFNWARFISASLLTLTMANFVVAFLYIFIFKYLYLQALNLSWEALTYLSIGLTIWWFVTMLPFMLLVTPPLVRAVASAFPSIVPEEVRIHSLDEDMPKLTFSLAMLIPGLILILVGLTTTFTVLGTYTVNFFGETTKAFIELMYYASGAVLSILGILVYIKQQIL